MRTLPRTPNLEYLKQQAKDLLDAIRETKPNASLAEAQQSLAKQYGFRTWPDLKAEVDRLRAKPEEADQELAAVIAKAFGLGDLTSPATLVANEVMGQALRIRTDSGDWLAHEVLDWVDAQQAEEAVRLIEAAANAGLRTPTPVRSANGSLLEVAGTQRWRIDEWMDFGPPIPKPASAAVASKIGELLGTLHNLKLAPTGGMNPWLTQRRTPERWHAISSIVEKAEASWSGTLAQALPSIIDLSEVSAQPPEESLILSNTNLVPSNLRTGEGGSLIVHEWEYAGAIPPAWEVGLVLHSWTEGVDADLNLAAAQPIIEAYSSVTGSRPALDISIFSPAITAWLNWLVSRMNFALGDEGDAREQATKELLNMLAFPLSREKLERILGVLE